MSTKFVYMFSEGAASMKNLLGGKGANLAEMTKLGLPIPQGFTVTTDACLAYYEAGQSIDQTIQREIAQSLALLERTTGKSFGDVSKPLLVSVRSGARVSMPGMMDTVLNLGLTDVTVEGMAIKTGNPRFAYDSYRRFIQMYSDVVKGFPKAAFEKILEDVKKAGGYESDLDLSSDDLKEVVKLYKSLYESYEGSAFPQDPKAQLMAAIEAVFGSWNNERAVIYRKMNDMPSSWGTAVTIQTMVFGNMGDTSGTGVAFTRNPSTGTKGIFGEYLLNAQGEDVVAGIRTPQAITSLEQGMPEVYGEFLGLANKLENHYKDMQDMEFTIEQGKLYFLQTRNGKRTAQAALKVVVDLVEEGMCTKEEALLKVDPKQLEQLLHPQFDPLALSEAVACGKGLPASPGAAAGKVYFTAADAVAARQRGERAILVRAETSPEDIEGMAVAEGILTVRGGMTSHAAVVARGMGRCCVSGCGDIKIHELEKSFAMANQLIREGDYISLDGSTGCVYLGDIKTVEAQMNDDFATLMTWADEVRRLAVRTNADNRADVLNAVKYGAEGVGLCRTEHMFFEEERIPRIREMIVAKTKEERQKALDCLLPYQKSDFKSMYEVLEDKPMTVRLLDPPLHEFLPHDEEDILALSVDMGISFWDLKSTVDGLHEFNPMLGHRGVRLAVNYPEIAQMQARAILEAAIEVVSEKGITIMPEIMIPLASEHKEFEYVKKVVVETCEKVKEEKDSDIKFVIGTMIEIPRAALTADEIALGAEFFSFGTNDLTQMTYGLSRDDSGSFLGNYYEKGIFESDPFQSLDQSGVGQLVQIACTKGRMTRPDIKLGICGEHGGDPSSIEFCHNAGLDYVSCSPFRVPTAKLAAAHAAINNR